MTFYHRRQRRFTRQAAMSIFSIWGVVVLVVTIAECNGDVTLSEPQHCNENVNVYMKNVARSILAEEFLPTLAQNDQKIAELEQKIADHELELKVLCKTSLESPCYNISFCRPCPKKTKRLPNWNKRLFKWMPS